MFKNWIEMHIWTQENTVRISVYKRFWMHSYSEKVYIKPASVRFSSQR